MALATEFLLALLNTPKIGGVTTKLVNSSATFKITQVSELLDVIIDVKKSHPRVPIPQLSDLQKGYEEAEKIIENCALKGIDILNFNDAEYPARLLKLHDHPIIGYVKGNKAALNSKNSVAVIGTREPSPFGFKAGKRIAEIMAYHNFTIVSGLAIGCDTAGHLGALEANAPTVAVLASGVDLIYPKENKELAEKILLTNGALFSEYAPGMKPQKSSFVERDRLQSGLSDALIVVETDIKGGTMHTVGFAQKQKLTVSCLSSHPINLQNHDKIRGNKYLIDRGAIALGTSTDIKNFITFLNPEIEIKQELFNPTEPKSNSVTFEIKNKEVALDINMTVTKEDLISRSSNAVLMETTSTFDSEKNLPNVIQEIVDATKTIKGNPTSFDQKVQDQLSRIESLLEQILSEQRKTNAFLAEKPSKNTGDAKLNKEKNNGKEQALKNQFTLL
jgi:DNA processing protein